MFSTNDIETFRASDIVEPPLWIETDVVSISFDRDLLRAQSQYVAGMTLRTNEPQRVCLPMVRDPALFLFESWVNKIHDAPGAEKDFWLDERAKVLAQTGDAEIGHKLASAAFKILLDCCIIADFLQMPEFLNELINVLVLMTRRYDMVPSERETARVWGATSPDCTLRQLLVDLYVFNGPEPTITDLLPPEFLGAVLGNRYPSLFTTNAGQRYIRTRSGRACLMLNRLSTCAEYHTHGHGYQRPIVCLDLVLPGSILHVFSWW